MPLQTRQATIQELRLQLRMVMLERCKTSADSLPTAAPLPRVCTELPLLKQAPTRAGSEPTRRGLCARHGPALAATCHACALGLLVMLLVASVTFFALSLEMERSRRSQTAFKAWAILQVRRSAGARDRGA